MQPRLLFIREEVMLMLAMKIAAAVILVIGFGTVICAKNIVNGMKLKERVKANFENDMDDEELDRYKFYKALVNVKLVGMIIALPGFILALIAFK
jgi:hypothetical protein